MHDAYIVLLGFCLWMIVLLFGMLVVRVKAINAGLGARDVKPMNENISPFAYRLSRAHANCYENLPIFASIVLVAAMTDTLAVLSGVVYVFLAARIAQSLAQLSSDRMRVTMVRGLLFGVQVMLQIYWIFMLFITNL